jgi:predicted protein tyrosine phosphatase
MGMVALPGAGHGHPIRKRYPARPVRCGYGGRMRKVLFLCTHNRLRSPTAEQVFSTWPGIETDSAGLGADAEVPLSPEQIRWADMIFVMEKVHRKKLSTKFKRYLDGKRVICLDIPDEYDYMQPELVRVLKERAGRFLK